MTRKVPVNIKTKNKIPSYRFGCLVDNNKIICIYEMIEVPTRLRVKSKDQVHSKGTVQDS